MAIYHRHFPLLATAIPHHKFRKLSLRQARKVGIVICGIGLITWSCPSTNHFHSADFTPQITFRIPHFHKLPIPLLRRRNCWWQ